MRNITGEILEKALGEYLNLRVGGSVFNCPYWRNRIKDNVINFYGFAGGKGKAAEIVGELKKKYEEEDLEVLSREEFIKFAKRYRIGIDCSGFVFHMLEAVFSKEKINYIEKFFPEGIRRTNADKLTANSYVTSVNTVSEIRSGDLIRMMSGKHVAIVIKTEKNLITYAHSSDKSKTKGVHKGMINIRDGRLGLEDQIWIEKTVMGINFALKHYSPQKGDGVVRYPNL